MQARSAPANLHPGVLMMDMYLLPVSVTRTLTVNQVWDVEMWVSAVLANVWNTANFVLLNENLQEIHNKSE